jgi:hypothetical protein
MKTITYTAIPVTERLPKIYNENYLTISEKGFENSRFFNGKRFESAHYEGKITHWLEKTKIKPSPVSQEEIKELARKESNLMDWNDESDCKFYQECFIEGFNKCAELNTGDLLHELQKQNAELKKENEQLLHDLYIYIGKAVKSSIDTELNTGKDCYTELHLRQLALKVHHWDNRKETLYELCTEYIQSLNPNTNGKKDI